MHLNLTIVKDEMNITIHVLKRAANVQVSLDIKLTTHDELNYRSVFKRTFNLCKYFLNPEREIMAELFLGPLKRSGHWFSKCPIEPVPIYTIIKNNFCARNLT